MSRRSAAPRERRVVIESGTHLADNLGDLAMLQVAIARLRSHWGSARIAVLSSSPDRLATHCPGVESLPAAGRYDWLRAGTAADRLLSRPRARVGGRVVATAVRSRALARRERDDDVQTLVRALRSADAFVLAGRGGTTDAFLADSLQTLALAGAAAALGIPAAAFGQGIGPIHDPGLARRAGAVLPRLALIGVREGALAPLELGRAGVASERIRVTGDDALALALPPGGEPARGDAVGVGLRTPDPIGLSEVALGQLATQVRAGVGRLRSRIVALPVALGQGDAAAVRRLAGESPIVGGEDVRTVPDLIARTACCRAAVTGSYHSAVFALAQGIPVVAIAGSTYYRRKFGGLAERFPGGVELIDAGGACEDALERAWHAPQQLRERLVSAAAAQAESSERAYADFVAIVDGRR